MKPAYTASRTSHTAWTIGIIAGLLTVFPSFAAPSQPTTASAALYAQHHEGVLIAADGTIRLHARAPAPPASEARYRRYGFLLSPSQIFAKPTTRVALDYVAAIPNGAAVRIDLRGSADGQRWSPWETDLTSGATVEFPRSIRMAQYRITLFGSDSASPALHSINVTPMPSQAQYHAMTDEIAPTFRVRATRMGMVGGRTANGYIIQPRAHFVSLPSWRALSSPGGREYQVRITYQGRSTVAPVWDVGPWNTRDDYWSVDRERYQELARGWPQDHAAYYDKHNGGHAEKGYVRFPTAIDVGDGVWWDALGIGGDQAEVEVTFLWLGRDPLAAPINPDPNASEFVVDELGARYYANHATWYSSPVGCGEGRHAYWTVSTTDPEQSENKAFWQPVLPVERLYDVYVHIPICSSKYPVTEQARYLVQHRDGAKEIVIDQSQQTHWVHLGRFPFAANDSGFIHLTDIAGDSKRTVWFDQAKWAPVP